MRRFLLIVIALTELLCVAAQNEGARLALRALCNRADSGDPEAIYRLARVYESGFDSIPADSVRALSLYRQAAGLEFMPAVNYYGFLVYNGRYGLEKPNHAAGRKLMEKAALSGDITAANNLGWMLLNDDSLEMDEKKAAYWLHKATEGGMPQAMSMLADLYREGRGVERDTIKAVCLYNRAIEAGLTDAAVKLLSMQRFAWMKLSADEAVKTGLYYYTHGAPAIGVVLFEQASDAGHPKAMALMADALTRALGASYDHDKALEYQYRGAVAGDPSSQFILAELLEFFPDALSALECSVEIPKEYTNPEYWYYLAREAGVTTAEEAAKRLMVAD